LDWEKILKKGGLGKEGRFPVPKLLNQDWVKEGFYYYYFYWRVYQNWVTRNNFLLDYGITLNNLRIRG